VYLVEVKTTKEKEFCIKPNIRKQLERMKEVAEKCNIEWMLAVKLKRKGWRFYEDKKMGI
jgi:Holliday junction resolvase